jgi:predicted nucleic acid-binding protein
MKLVIDTSILIDYLRNGSKGEEFFENKTVDQQFFLPTIVLFELFSGESTQNQDTVGKIRKFIRYFPRIELTESIAKKAGEIYRDIDKHLDVPDYIIAASAFEIHAQVVTLNQKHFQKIPGLNLYALS